MNKFKNKRNISKKKKLYRKKTIKRKRSLYSGGTKGYESSIEGYKLDIYDNGKIDTFPLWDYKETTLHDLKIIKKLKNGFFTSAIDNEQLDENLLVKDIIHICFKKLYTFKYILHNSELFEISLPPEYETNAYIITVEMKPEFYDKLSDYSQKLKITIQQKDSNAIFPLSVPFIFIGAIYEIQHPVKVNGNQYMLSFISEKISDATKSKILLCLDYTGIYMIDVSKLIGTNDFMFNLAIEIYKHRNMANRTLQYNAIIDNFNYYYQTHSGIAPDMANDEYRLQIINSLPVPESLDVFSLSCNIIRMKTGEEIYCIPSLFTNQSKYDSVIEQTRNYINTDFFKSNYALRSAGTSLSRSLGEKLSGDFISLTDKQIFFYLQPEFPIMNIFKNFILHISKQIKAKATTSISYLVNAIQLNVMENNTYENSNIGIHSDYSYTTKDKSFRRTILMYINLLKTDIIGFSTKITKTVDIDLPEFTIYNTIEKITILEKIITNPFIKQFSKFASICIKKQSNMYEPFFIKSLVDTYNIEYNTKLLLCDIAAAIPYFNVLSFVLDTVHTIDPSIIEKNHFLSLLSGPPVPFTNTNKTIIKDRVELLKIFNKISDSDNNTINNLVKNIASFKRRFVWIINEQLQKYTTAGSLSEIEVLNKLQNIIMSISYLSEHSRTMYFTKYDRQGAILDMIYKEDPFYKYVTNFSEFIDTHFSDSDSEMKLDFIEPKKLLKYKHDVVIGEACHFTDGGIVYFNGELNHTIDAGIGKRVSIVFKVLFEDEMEEKDPTYTPLLEREKQFFIEQERITKEKNTQLNNAMSKIAPIKRRESLGTNNRKSTRKHNF